MRDRRPDIANPYRLKVVTLGKCITPGCPRQALFFCLPCLAEMKRDLARIRARLVEVPPGKASLRPDQVCIQIDRATSAYLDKPADGPGGFQGLCRKLQQARWGRNWLILDKVLMERVTRYAAKYGDGGFERRFRSVLKAIKNAEGKT